MEWRYSATFVYFWCTLSSKAKYVPKKAGYNTKWVMISCGFSWTFIFQENLDFRIFSWLCSNIQSWKWWISNSNFRDVWKVVIQNLTTSYPSFHIFDKYHPFHIFEKYHGEIWIDHKHFSLVLWQFCIENYEMILDRLTFAFGLFMAEYNLNMTEKAKR